MMKLFLLALIAVFFSQTSHARAYTDDAEGLHQEKHDRRVDEVALQTKLLAIARLNKLIERYRNSPEQAAMYLKLARYQEQVSAIQFRISYGWSAEGERKDKSTVYEKSLKNILQTTTALIDNPKFKNLAELDQVFFISANAYENLGDKLNARKAYLSILNRFPQSSLIGHTNMALAEFEIEENRYLEAIKYLSRVEKMPEDSHYPFALYKLAWSNYNLKNIPKAISYIERNISYYKAKQKAAPSKKLNASDQALEEHSLLDLSIFYLEGFEENLSDYGIANVIENFKKVESGPLLGVMLLRFARLLRAHGHDAELLFLESELVKKEPFLSETLSVVMVTMEHLFNQKNFEKMLEIGGDLKALDAKTQGRMRHFESYSTAQKALLDTAERIQKVILKNQNAGEAQLVKFVKALKGVYQAYLGIVPEQDPYIPVVHYNLAEILFGIKEYAQSTEHYRWILDHWSKSFQFKKEDVLLKVISSRYQDLYRQGLIAKSVNPTKVSKTTPDPKISQPALSEWIAWVDSYPLVKSGSEIENFIFEANRTLYSQKILNAAISRLIVFAEKHLDSKFFNPSLKLVLDSYIVSELWEELYATADHFHTLYKESKMKTPELEKLLAQVSTDASYKLIERDFQHKAYEEALKKVDAFKDRYESSPRMGDVLYLASQIALQGNEPDQARKYLKEMLAKYPQSANRGAALLTRASLAEKRYQFDVASEDLELYLKEASGKKDSNADAIAKKLFVYHWLASTPTPLSCHYESQEIERECEKFQALIFLKNAKLKVPDVRAFTKDGPEGNRALWAMLALRDQKELNTHEQLHYSRVISNGWDRLDSLSKFATVAYLDPLFSSALENARHSLDQMVPLRVSSRSIELRIEWMTEIERTASQIAKLPWAKLKTRALGEIALMYSEFTQQLSKLPMPKEYTDQERASYQKSVAEVVTPFQSKGEKLRAQAIEIASTLGVERDLIDAIDPTHRKPASHSVPSVGLSFLKNLNPQVDWKKSDSSLSGEVAEARWVEAYEKKDYPQMAYFLQEILDKARPGDFTISTLRVLSLFSVGAQAEALAELENMKTSDLKKSAQIHEVLYAFYSNSLNDKKAKRFEKKVEAPKK